MIGIKNYEIKGKHSQLHYEEFELEWNGKQELFEMRELTYGEHNDLVEESTQIQFIGKQSTGRISQKKWRENSILKSLVKAPFTIDLANIQGLNKNTGNYLYDKFEELNSIEEKKSETSEDIVKEQA